MSTNSIIGIRNKDGTCESVYCHWDGYIKNNGRILQQHYNSEDKVRALLKLGDISSLGVNPVGAGPDSWRNDYKMTLDANGDYLKCRIYRDRGDVTHSRQWSSIDSFPMSEYDYLFDTLDNTWYVRRNNAFWETLASNL